ncbi:MAG TPA: hypothetical protein VE197_01930, partial [Mycobacterium sp.]|nr:hypothetical protein [Mycobacterium sp.]
ALRATATPPGVFPFHRRAGFRATPADARAAAKVLVRLPEKLRSASAHGRRGGLALVRTMTEKGGA